MTNKNSQYTVYESILEPWTRLATLAPNVINLRLAALPWMWAFNPVQAITEIQRMVTEKQDALTETTIAITQTPLQLWLDTCSAYWSASPQTAYNDALIKSSQRVAQPYNKRVKANQHRLTK